MCLLCVQDGLMNMNNLNALDSSSSTSSQSSHASRPKNNDRMQLAVFLNIKKVQREATENNPYHVTPLLLCLFLLVLQCSG